MEIWKDVEGWEGLYQVSDQGRVKILARTVAARNRWGPMMRKTAEKIMKAGACGGPYRRVNLVESGRMEPVLVHRLVCHTFNGPCPADGMHCAHNDGNPLNNAASNLRWATAKENSEDTRRHGNLRAGEASNLSRLTADDVHAIRAAFENGETTADLAARYKMTKNGIRLIVNRTNWRHI